MRTPNPKLHHNAAGYHSRFNLWIISLLIMIAAHCFYGAQILGLEDWLVKFNPLGFTYHEIRQGAVLDYLPAALLPYIILGIGILATYGAMRLIWNTYAAHARNSAAEENESVKFNSIFDYEGLSNFYTGVGVYMVSALFFMLLIAPAINGYVQKIGSEISPIFESQVREGAINLASYFMLAVRTFLVVTIPVYLGMGTVLRRWQFHRENIFQTLYALIASHFSRDLFAGAAGISALYYLLINPAQWLLESSERTQIGWQFFFWHAVVVITLAMTEHYCMTKSRRPRSGVRTAMNDLHPIEPHTGGGGGSGVTPHHRALAHHSPSAGHPSSTPAHHPASPHAASTAGGATSATKSPVATVTVTPGAGTTVHTKTTPKSPKTT